MSSDSRGASFRFANLVNASLSNAKLNGANFDGAMLRGAELSDADVRSFIDRTAGGRLVITDLSKAKWLQQHAVDEMIGDKATVLPARLSRPAHWGEVDVDLTPPDATKGPEALADLDAPLVRASSVDFKFTEAGIEARLSEAQAIHPPELAGDCGLRRDALIANARDIATTINNQLAIDARHDLESYAAHLETADPANPYRLNFIATGIQGDLEDDFKSGGFDKRLRKRLESFLNEHGAFLSECAPAAAEAIRIKTEAQLAEVISKERATEMLATLTAAIEATENAAHSATKMLDDLKAHDAVMNAHKVKLYAAQEVTRFEASVQAEAKELISITSRLYFRAKEVLEVARPKTVQDVAAYTVVGDVAQAGAKIIIEHLTPMMQWFAKLLS